MPHGGPHTSWFKVNADLVAFGTGPEGEVMLRLDLPQDETVLVLQMSVADAKRIAEGLTAKANEVAG